MGFETVARTHVGCRRKVNEDAILARPELRLWSVADGMGGHHAGDVASALVIETLAQTPGSGDVHTRARAARVQLEAANRRLRELGDAGPERKTIGSTVVALLVEDGVFSCLWAGDSRIYLARGPALTQLTKDHSLVQELVDLGEIDPADARTHPNGNVITRAVGADEGLDVDVVAGDVEPGDVFLLASDGLTRLLTDDELLAGLQAEGLDRAADHFIDACLARGAPDNVSFVMVRVGPGSI
jgi:serine/threonine protein phosphatase Stp1